MIKQNLLTQSLVNDFHQTMASQIEVYFNYDKMQNIGDNQIRFDALAGRHFYINMFGTFPLFLMKNVYEGGGGEGEEGGEGRVGGGGSEGGGEEGEGGGLRRGKSNRCGNEIIL